MDSLDPENKDGGRPVILLNMRAYSMKSAEEKTMERKGLRDRLNREFPTDSDLSAFILDCFPSVYKKLSDGMNRVQKVNYLFESHDDDEIRGKLRRYLIRKQSRWAIWAFSIIGLGGLLYNLAVEPPPPKIPPVETEFSRDFAVHPDLHLNQLNASGWNRILVNGEDRCGRKAEFGVSILDSDHSWKFREDNSVEINRHLVVYTEHLERISPMLRHKIPEKLICVGSASEEGDDDSEGARSKRRARQLRVWLQEILEGLPPRYTLALGRYRTTEAERLMYPSSARKDDFLAIQRSVVVIEIVTKHENVIVKEALKDALKRAYRRNEIRYDVDNFSEFTLEPDDNPSELDCPTHSS